MISENLKNIRVKILREMDDYARDNFQDDENFMYWLILGVPDAADNDILEFIAKNEENWIGVVKCFADCCKSEGLIE